MSIKYDPPTIYGVATVGPKGQIVIPVDARHRLGVESGDKIVIIGHAHKPQLIGLCGEKSFKNVLEKFDKKLSGIKSAFEAGQKKKDK